LAERQVSQPPAQVDENFELVAPEVEPCASTTETQALPEVAVKPVDEEVEPEESTKDQSYDLQDRGAFAQFLIDADIRLVRGRFLKKLYRDGLTLPRRQEADSMMVGFLPALVSHEEIQMWAADAEIEEKDSNLRDLDDWERAERSLQEAARQAKIVAVSHVWESREHPDPHGYQLRKLAQMVDAGAWFFFDYVSLYQFQRSAKSQEQSFKRAMQNMHVIYAHEHTSTLRIESLTPSEERKVDDAMVRVYHAPSGEVKPVRVAELVANKIPYLDRGWCIAELKWSATRSVASLSKEIDEADADAAGQAPMPPEVFEPLFRDKLKFTHRTDIDAVLKAQHKVFHEKASKNEVLKLANLSSTEVKVVIGALHHYPVLRRLEISRSSFGDVESVFLSLLEALRSSTITELVLRENDLGLEHALFVTLIKKVLREKIQLKLIDLKENRIDDEGALALAQVLLECPDAALKVDLEGNELGTGALILALVLKFCQETLILVHPFVEVCKKSIQVPELDKITASLCALTHLSLDLMSTDFPLLLEALTGAVHKLQKLGSLSLNFRAGINIGTEGCKVLSENLGKLLQLTTLSVVLRDNSVGSEGCKALSEGLGRLLQLTTLSVVLRDNRVGSEGCKALSEGLGKCP